MRIERIKQLYQQACLQELQSLKPGNVHIFADGHGMSVMDFIKSAEVSSTFIAKENATVGERIYLSIKATHDALGMNTNLGIILLCAPLLQAMATCEGGQQRCDIHHLKAALKNTLESLTVDDAQQAAQAIVLANPAGLGATNEHDVNEVPSVTLLEMMDSAKDSDRIAWQYATQFSDVFDQGLVVYEDGLAKWDNELWATTWVFINYMATLLDSHVVRKYGLKAARLLMVEAQSMQSKIISAGHPKLVRNALQQWDADLKARKINPGTSADLTVATVFTAACCKKA